MTWNRVLGYLSFLLLLTACFTQPLFAQKITGDISGIITDGTGAVVNGVNVTAVNSGTGAPTAESVNWKPVEVTSKPSVGARAGA